MSKIKITSLFVLFFSFLLLSQAQDDNCVAVEGFSADLSFTSDLFPGKCAQFALDQDHFYFQSKAGKAPVKIMLGDQLDRSLVLGLVEKKTIKKAVDALFLVDAIDAWTTERVALKEKKYAETKYSAAELEAFEFEMQESGLGIHVLEKGSGPLPEKGKPVAVHYRGYLLNGKIFDESYKRGSAFSFPLGMGRVIKGWDEGIAKLPTGSHALLKVPADLGYGARGSGPIPPNSTLIFDVFVKGN